MSDSSSSSIYLERLAGALVGAVEEGRIGLPRFVRWLEPVDDSRALEDVVSSASAVCNQIFGSQPIREHRSGDGVEQVTLQAAWNNGSSALISVGPAGTGRSVEPEIMLLGSSGAMYFDGALGGSPTVEKVGRG